MALTSGCSAEGVETADQLVKLKGLDCEYGQGYLFAKPADGKAAEALIAGSYAASKRVDYSI
jgi:EAL domain-containing protein (putative c-di-GMP-specific phosphodiesterase class I)